MHNISIKKMIKRSVSIVSVAETKSSTIRESLDTVTCGPNIIIDLMGEPSLMESTNLICGPGIGPGSRQISWNINSRRACR